MSKKYNKNSDFNKSVEHYKKGLMVSSKKKTAILITVAATVVTFGALGGGHYIYKATHPPVIDIDKWVVKFNTDGGDKINDILIDKGGMLEAPKSPSKENLTFGGWYLDKECTYKCNFPLKVENNLTLYACWNAVFTFETNGGSVISPQTYKYGAKVSKPDNPIKQHFGFIDWYTDPQLKNKFEFTESTVADKNTKLYAKWDQNEFTVTFVYDNGDVPGTKIVVKGNPVEKPDEPTYQGHTFGGWYKDILRTEPYEFSSIVTKDITLYAKWTKDQYQYVYFFYGIDEKGEYRYDTVEVKKDHPVTRIKNPEYGGYNFINWYKDSNYIDLFDFDTKINEDTIIYAKWEQREKFVTEDEYKESFENIVNISDDRDLNYLSQGRICKRTNDVTDFDINDLRIEKDGNGDREAFYSEEDKKSYITDKNGPFYTYLHTEDNEGVFDYFKNENIRDQLGEMFQEIYNSYFEYKYDNYYDQFSYDGEYTTEEGKYKVNTQISFTKEKKLNRVLCNYDFISTSKDKHIEVVYAATYYYGEQHVVLPLGDWTKSVSEKTLTLKAQSDRFVNFERLNSEYSKGSVRIKLTNDSNKLTPNTLRCFGGLTSVNYYDMSIDNTFIYKNNKLLVNGTDYELVDSKISESQSVKVIKFKENIIKGDELDIVLDNKEALNEPSYYELYSA